MSMLLGEALHRSASRNPGQIALFFHDERVSYGTLLETAACLGFELIELGVRPGDRVALLLDNCPEFIYGYYAVLLAGGAVVPTNTFLVNPEIESIYRHAEVKLLITSREFASRLEPIVRNIPSLRGTIVTDADEEGASGEETGGLPRYNLNSLMDDGRNGVLPKTEVSPSQLAVLQYTSGTTGKPKGVMLSHQNLLTNAAAVSKATSITARDRFFLGLPAFHSFSQTVCILTAVLKGASICMVPKIDRTELGFSLLNHRPTIFPGIPALFHMMSMAEGPPPDQNPIRLYISGGAPLPRAVRERFESNYKKPIYEGYGLTEASPVVSWNLPGKSRAGTVGRPIEGLQVRVIDDAGETLSPGEIGELCVLGGSVMLGYFRAEQETQSAIENGWLRTGDMAKIDDEGYITIVERKKELILHKGINVYPSEIESVLLRREEIADVAVVGVQDEAHGESPEAVVAFRPECTVSESELKSLCRENLAAYKVPRKFHFMKQLPKTPTGKTRKSELRAALEAGRIALPTD